MWGFFSSTGLMRIVAYRMMKKVSIAQYSVMFSVHVSNLFPLTLKTNNQRLNLSRLRPQSRKQRSPLSLPHLLLGWTLDRTPRLRSQWRGQW